MTVKIPWLEVPRPMMGPRDINTLIERQRQALLSIIGGPP